MRPDKKKTRHHDSMKCEAKAKQKAAEKAKKETKGQTTKVTDDDTTTEDEKLPSNWAKYELPPSDEEDDDDIVATGADFQFVLDNSSAKSAENFLQLKSEKQWTENSSSCKEFTSEFFALNLNNLEDVIETVPFYQLLDIPKSDLDVNTFFVIV